MVGNTHRLHTSRPVAIRLMVIQACKQLSAAGSSEIGAGFHNVNHVLRQVEQQNPLNEPPVTLGEMLVICDTEGNPQNGGGSFVIKNEGPRGTFVKFEPDINVAPTGAARRSIIPGDIGSPIPGSSSLAPGGTGLMGSSRAFPPSNLTPTSGF
jgi:hypothetical protein